jgi:O-antigen/teichoic acid export membrane protein
VKNRQAPLRDGGHDAPAVAEHAAEPRSQPASPGESSSPGAAAGNEQPSPNGGNPVGEPYDDSSKPLLERTFHAAGWQFATVMAKYLLQFLVVAVLSRLLSPEDFGLVAQAMIFIGLANLFSDIGVAPALIQRKTITDGHVRVAFTFSVVTGLLMAAMAWLTAWVPAAVFHAPALEPLLKLLSVTLFLKSVGITATCLLMRRLDFRRWFWIYISAYVVGSAAVGVSMALAGYGAWALAWAYVTQDALAAVILLIVVRHPMRFLFARTEARQLLGFGVGMTLSRLTHYATENLDRFVIGRWLGTAPLGLYTRAYEMLTVSNMTFAQVLSRVMFPAFSRMQDQPTRLWNAYLCAVSTVSLIAFPIFTGLAVVAPEAVHLVFGPQWNDAVLPLQILCAGGVFWSVTTLSDAVAHGLGAVYKIFHRRIVLAAAIFLGAFLGSRNGISGVAVGVAASMVMMYFLMAQLCFRLTQGNWRQFASCQVPGICTTALITSAAHSAAVLLRANGLPLIVTLGGTVLTGVLTGVVAVLALPRAKLPESSRWTLQKIDASVAKAVLILEGRGFPVPFLAGRLEK